jgi:glycosyltransferase involved in cell wall biosynthesis
VHFISNYTKQQTLFGNRKNSVIIPNTSHFEQYVHIDDLNRNKLNYRSILIVRSIEERARFDLLLQVAEHFNEKKYIFKVAGRGPLLEYFQREIQIRKLKNIEMLGYVADPELLQLYSDCDIVLMIAEYGEGFGLPIIEGYLFNKPVIASDVCATPEVIIDNTFLFKNEVDDIIKKIYFASNRQNINYRNFYFKKFGNQNIVFQFGKLYKTLLIK